MTNSRSEAFDAAQSALDTALAACRTREEAASTAMRVIAARLSHYDWVGVYWLEGAELRLGPYVGAATEHTRIAVGVGVCGTAVAEGRNQLVADVRERANYLACSLKTRAEIVVLIRDASGAILGQIDADGHEVGAFDKEDEAFLEFVASRLAAKPAGV